MDLKEVSERSAAIRAAYHALERDIMVLNGPLRKTPWLF